MIEDMTGVYSEEYTKRKTKEKFREAIARWKYVSRWWPIFNAQTPCFFDYTCANHECDIENIRATLRRKRISKEEISLIVFDKHTDMYPMDSEKSRQVIKQVVKIGGNAELNCANWLLWMLKMGYSGISLIGATDFTNNHTEEHNPHYWTFRDKIDFFVDDSFDKQKEFGQEECSIEFRRICDFGDKPLRRYSFISLDCDVSEAFNPHPSYTRGVCGSMKLNDVTAAIADVRKRSQLIGMSIYGVCGDPGGIFNSFSRNEQNLERVLEAANKKD